MIFNGATNEQIKRILSKFNDYALKTQLLSAYASYKNLDFDAATTTKIYCGSGIPSAMGAANYPEDTTGALIVFNGYPTVYQIYVTYTGNVHERSKHISYGWSEWEKTTTKADLANYMPKTGGYFTGETGIGDSNTAKNYTFGYRANGHYLGHQLLSYGDFRLVELGTMDKVYESVKGSSGRVNTFYGTATNANYLKAMHSNEVNFKGLTGIEQMFFNFRNADTDKSESTTLKQYCFGDKSGSDANYITLDMTQGSGVRNILHSGNCTKIAFTESDAAAPSDTTALWAHL